MAKDKITNIGSNSAAELLNIIERIESLVEDRKGINEDIKYVKAEAEAKGFDKKTINEMLKIRKLDAMELEAQEHLRDTYLIALGLM